MAILNVHRRSNDQKQFFRRVSSSLEISLYSARKMASNKGKRKRRKVPRVKCTDAFLADRKGREKSKRKVEFIPVLKPLLAFSPSSLPKDMSREKESLVCHCSDRCFCCSSSAAIAIVSLCVSACTALHALASFSLSITCFGCESVCVNGYVKTQTNHDDEQALSLIKHGVLISTPVS